MTLALANEIEWILGVVRGEEMEFDVVVHGNMTDSFSWAAAHCPNASRVP